LTPSTTHFLGTLLPGFDLKFRGTSGQVDFFCRFDPDFLDGRIEVDKFDTSTRPHLWDLLLNAAKGQGAKVYNDIADDDDFWYVGFQMPDTHDVSDRLACSMFQKVIHSSEAMRQNATKSEFHPYLIEWLHRFGNTASKVYIFFKAKKFTHDQIMLYWA
jgi:hypothetical protein